MSYPLRSLGCMSLVLDPRLAAAFDAVVVALDGLVAVGVQPVDARDAVAVVSEVETCARRLASLQLSVITEIDGGC